MRHASDTSSRIPSVVCLFFAAGLLMGAVCWIGVLLVIANLGRIESAAIRVPLAAGAFQVLVSMLFGVSGALFLRRSQHAKRFLTAAVISLLAELPLVLIAFGKLIASNQ